MLVLSTTASSSLFPSFFIAGATWVTVSWLDWICVSAQRESCWLDRAGVLICNLSSRELGKVRADAASRL